MWQAHSGRLNRGTHIFSLGTRTPLACPFLLSQSDWEILQVKPSDFSLLSHTNTLLVVYVIVSLCGIRIYVYISNFMYDAALQNSLRIKHVFYSFSNQLFRYVREISVLLYNGYNNTNNERIVNGRIFFSSLDLLSLLLNKIDNIEIKE